VGDSVGGSDKELPESPAMPKIGTAKLLKKIKVRDTWKLAPAWFDSKGRVRRDHVEIDGKDEVHAEGSYYLEWWSGGARSREAGGPEAFVAAERAHRKQAELSAARSGLIDLYVPPPDPSALPRPMPLRSTGSTSAAIALYELFVPIVPS
jgi:hypothetical protein